MTSMTLGINDLPDERHKPAIWTELLERRKQLKLSRREVAEAVGVDPSSLQRWEMDPNNEHSRRISAEEYQRLIQFYDRHGRERPTDVPRGTNGESRLPIAVLLRSPAIRAWLAAFQAELIERGASPEYEESVIASLRDREFLARFADRSVDDGYTETELIQAMENIALAARRFLAGPMPDAPRGAQIESPGIPAPRRSDKKAADDAKRDRA